MRIYIKPGSIVSDLIFFTVMTSLTTGKLNGFSSPSLSIVSTISLPGLPRIIFTASMSDIPLTDLPSNLIIKSPALTPARCAGVSSIGDITLTKPSS